MATVVSTIFLASCAGDVYDPSKEPQAPPAENPFGFTKGDSGSRLSSSPFR